MTFNISAGKGKGKNAAASRSLFMRTKTMPGSTEARRLQAAPDQDGVGAAGQHLPACAKDSCASIKNRQALLSVELLNMKYHLSIIWIRLKPFMLDRLR